MDVRVGPQRKLSTEKLILLNYGVGEDSWESLGLQKDQTIQSLKKSVLNNHWKLWCWSWNSNILAIWCAEPSHLKTPWCWERLKAEGEGDDRGWDGWMVIIDSVAMSLIKLYEMVKDRDAWHAAVLGAAKFGHNWATDLNWILCFSL